MRELDCEEIKALKNWCFWTVVLEKTLESPLDCKKIQQVHPKGNQSWIFIGRTAAKAETPVLWPPHAKRWLIGKDSDAGRDWGQEEKGMTEDEMIGWHHRPNGHEFECTSGVGDGQGSLVCCISWGHKKLDTTEWLNWTELKNVKNSFNNCNDCSHTKNHGVPWQAWYRCYVYTVSPPSGLCPNIILSTRPSFIPLKFQSTFLLFYFSPKLSIIILQIFKTISNYQWTDRSYI